MVPVIWTEREGLDSPHIRVLEHDLSILGIVGVDPAQTWGLSG